MVSSEGRGPECVGECLSPEISNRLGLRENNIKLRRRKRQRPGSPRTSGTAWSREVVRGADETVTAQEVQLESDPRRNLGVLESSSDWDKVKRRTYPYSTFGRVVLYDGSKTFYW